MSWPLKLNLSPLIYNVLSPYYNSPTILLPSANLDLSAVMTGQILLPSLFFSLAKSKMKRIMFFNPSTIPAGSPLLRPYLIY